LKKKKSESTDKIGVFFFCRYIKYQQKNMAHDFNKKLYFLMRTMIYTLPHKKKVS